MLAQPRHALRHLEHRADNIMTTIPQTPQFLQRLQRRIHLPFPARLNHRLHLDRMWTIHHPEHVVPAHEPETRERALQVVDRLPHVAFRAEDKRRDAVVAVRDVFRGADLQQAVHDLRVGEP